MAAGVCEWLHMPEVRHQAALGAVTPEAGAEGLGGDTLPGFHQQLPSDGEHGGEAKGGAHCGGRRG